MKVENKVPFYPEGAVLLAPLSGYTDLPYRRSARRHGCVYAFAEMVDVSSLAWNHAKSLRMLERGGEESFLGCQLIGSNMDALAKAVDVVNEKGDFDILDLNLGCPVPKASKKFAGAELGRNIDAAESVYKKMASLSRYPVSAKMRIISETDPQPTIDLACRLEAAGAVALTIHGRIKEKIYSGPVFGGIIRQVQEALSIPVVANGGIMDRESAESLRKESGCSRIMVARGAMGNPWIFSELSGNSFSYPTLEELMTEMREHVMDMAEYYGAETAFKLGRKILLDYLKGRGFASECRRRASLVNTMTAFEELMELIAGGPAAIHHLTVPERPNL